MGYQTDYEVRFLDDGLDDSTKDNILDRISEVSGYGTLWGDRGLYGCKWYDWEEHMKQVSSEFPGVLLKLEGVGEENGDLWHAYFKDGKCQVCSADVVYPPFDESKLK